MNGKEVAEIVLYAVLIFAVFKLLQKFGIFDDKDDRGAEKLKGNTKLNTTDVKDFGDVKGKGLKLLTGAQVTAIAKDVYNAKGNVYDDDSKAISAIKKIKNLDQLKQLTTTFSMMFNKDFATYLNFMDKDNQNRVNDYIDSLPVH